jgi:hypothetical protein
VHLFLICCAKQSTDHLSGVCGGLAIVIGEPFMAKDRSYYKFIILGVSNDID